MFLRLLANCDLNTAINHLIYEKKLYLSNNIIKNNTSEYRQSYTVKNCSKVDFNQLNQFSVNHLAKFLTCFKVFSSQFKLQCPSLKFNNIKSLSLYQQLKTI